ncbi:hypothetical protein [Micromonospora sp. WMMD1155]|nr:hypothetical protein [Micromonospora sp. WMMD1155]WFE51031.1 hypothetical protein O7617_12145 [Micromonospora sp. WMMD1155]
MRSRADPLNTTSTGEGRVRTDPALAACQLVISRYGDSRSAN